MNDDQDELPDEFFDPHTLGDEDGGRVDGVAAETSVAKSSGHRAVASGSFVRLPGWVPTALASRVSSVWLAAAPLLRKRRVQAGIALVCALALALGVVFIVLGSTAKKDPPTAAAPPAAEAVVQVPTEQLVAPTSAASSSSTPTPDPTVSATGSIPIRITVPAIGVDANIIQLGLNSDKTVQVPSLSQVRTAGWYKYSSTPGALGSSVILGHIDSAQYGLGVFFKLGDVKQGNLVTVLRADHMLATFSVTAVAEYPKTAFPSQQVYGSTPQATLRLVTCGGRFDAATGSYLDNIVVYGNLVSLAHT